MLRTTLHNLPRAWPYLVVTALSILVFLPTWLGLLERWLRWEQVLAHGLPTFLLYLWLLLIHPPRGPGFQSMSNESKRPRWPVVESALLLLVTLTWALFELVNIDTLGFLMLPLGVIALSLTLLGWQATLRFIPYVALLSLGLPIWGDFIPILVGLASVAVGNFVDWWGMTALIEGSSITLPYGRLVIADGCSGIRYFAISILLAATISILNDYRWSGWMLSLTLAMALGILSNWVRIAGLVIVAYQSEMQSSLMTDHEMYGWIVYAAIAFPALFLAPVRRRDGASLNHVSFRLNGRALAPVTLVALLGPVLLWTAGGSFSTQAGWEMPIDDAKQVSRRPLPVPLQLPDNLDQTEYQLGSGQVWMSLAQYQRANSDEKLVPYLGNLVDSDRWHRSLYTEQNTDQRPVMIYRNLMSQRQVAQMQWYLVGPFTTDDYRLAKLLQIPSSLQGDNRFALVTLQIPCRTRTCQSEVSTLRQEADDLNLQPARL